MMDKHKLWLILGIVIAILALAFLFYSPAKTALFGKAVAPGVTGCTDDQAVGTADTGCTTAGVNTDCIEGPDGTPGTDDDICGIELDACKDFGWEEDGRYYLTDDVEDTSTDGCFVFSGATTKVLLNCQGNQVSKTGGVDGYGVSITDTANDITVRDCSITGFLNGVRIIGNANKNVVDENEFVANSMAVSIAGDENIVNGNIFNHNTQGGVVLLPTAERNILARNRFNPTTDGNYGIEVQGDENILVSNWINGLVRGLIVRGTDNKLISNSITDSANNGISFAANANNNVLKDNVICDNGGDPPYDIGCVTPLTCDADDGLCFEGTNYIGTRSFADECEVTLGDNCASAPNLDPQCTNRACGIAVGSTSTDAVCGLCGTGLLCDASYACSYCGNGVVEGTEECDPGDTTTPNGQCTGDSTALCNEDLDCIAVGGICQVQATDTCSATCQTEGSSDCGDGTLDSGEECDDGDTDDGDGCDANCERECITEPAGLYSWFKGEDDAIDTKGTVTAGSGTLIYNEGIFGNAFGFGPSGVNKVVDIGENKRDFNFVETTGVFSISAWIKLSDYTEVRSQGIVGNTNTRASKGFYFQYKNEGLDGGYLELNVMRGTRCTDNNDCSGSQTCDTSTGGSVYYCVGGGNNKYVLNVQSPTNVISDTEWHHVAVSSDGVVDAASGDVVINFYVDGQEYSVTAPIGDLSVAKSDLVAEEADHQFKLRIGAFDNADGSSGGANRMFKGSIDELQIYNTALTDDEVVGLYNSREEGFCVVGGSTENTARQCTDGVDNDDDSLIDCADPDCLGVCCGGNTDCVTIAGGGSILDENTDGTGDGVPTPIDICPTVGLSGRVYTPAQSETLRGCFYGDVTFDGCVDLDDIPVIAADVGKACPTTLTNPGNDVINDDNCVDLDDIAVIAENVDPILCTS